MIEKKILEDRFQSLETHIAELELLLPKQSKELYEQRKNARLNNLILLEIIEIEKEIQQDTQNKKESINDKQSNIKNENKLERKIIEKNESKNDKNNNENIKENTKENNNKTNNKNESISNDNSDNFSWYSYLFGTGSSSS